MGAYGEQTLVNIYGKEPDCNLKLRTCIVRALALSNVNNASIDFVIEMLFKASRYVVNIVVLVTAIYFDLFVSF